MVLAMSDVSVSVGGLRVKDLQTYFVSPSATIVPDRPKMSTVRTTPRELSFRAGAVADRIPFKAYILCEFCVKIM